MKMSCWLVIGMTVATGAVAQVNTNTLPPIPPPMTAPAAPVTPEINAPAKKIAKKSGKKFTKNSL